MTKIIGGKQLSDMIAGGAAVLERNKAAIDALNVFPVPDGDTGTNMALTALSAAKEVAMLPNGKIDDIREVVKAVSLGALKGARGNSGVILSQIFAGFADGIKNMIGDLDTKKIAAALTRGVEFAYKAVMKPKEGTILTVAKSVAKAATDIAKQTDDFYEQLLYMIKVGDETLKRTPEMLSVLKEAGVVDSGGAGFLVLLNGFKAILQGEDTGVEDYIEVSQILNYDDAKSEVCDLKYPYCTEFFIKNLYSSVKENDIEKYRHYLADIGDCVLVVGDLNLIKTHVHTNEPGKALEYAQKLGELSRIKIDNMREQHRNLSYMEFEDDNLIEEIKNVDVVTISVGDGIKEIFKECHIENIVDGGQSMNPSAESIMEAIKKCRAKYVIILPNNKNIILSAQQAADMSTIETHVLDTTTIPQGIAAAIAFNPDKTGNENLQSMKKAFEVVGTGQVTNAIRNTTIDGKNINTGDILGIANGQIIINGKDILTTLKALLLYLLNEDSEMVTFYYGDSVKKEDASILFEDLKKEFSSYDLELMYGGQPTYSYLIGVE